jgi:hypothetical protein
MSLLITPTTELEAVNEMLTAIGTTPVNSLAVSGLTDAAIAKDTLAFISREVQSRGWWFNTNRGMTLNPSANEIAVPSNYIRVTPSLPSSSGVGETRQFTVRNGKLFDLLANNSTFMTSVKADVVLLLDFEHMPESARRYATIRAARIFQTKVMGDEQLGVFNSIHEQEAWQILEGDHLSCAPSSIYLERIRTRFGSVRPDPVSAPQRNQQG